MFSNTYACVAPRTIAHCFGSRLREVIRNSQAREWIILCPLRHEPGHRKRSYCRREKCLNATSRAVPRKYHQIEGKSCSGRPVISRRKQRIKPRATAQMKNSALIMLSLINAQFEMINIWFYIRRAYRYQMIWNETNPTSPVRGASSTTFARIGHATYIMCARLLYTKPIQLMREFSVINRKWIEREIFCEVMLQRMWRTERVGTTNSAISCVELFLHWYCSRVSESEQIEKRCSWFHWIDTSEPLIRWHSVSGCSSCCLRDLQVNWGTLTRKLLPLYPPNGNHFGLSLLSIAAS